MEDKLTIVNTFEQQSDVTINSNKSWTGDPIVTRPDVTIILQRRIEGGVWENVPDVDKFIPDKETGGNKTWENLLNTDLDGNKYEYRVVETFDEELVTNHNWVIIYNDDGPNKNVINRVINNNGGDPDDPNDPGDPDDPNNPNHPDEKIGKIKVTKVLKNENNPNYRFKVKVTGPYGVIKNGDLEYFEVKAGETIEIKELYYGDYTVEEIDLPAGRYTVTIDKPTFVLDKKFDENEVLIPPVAEVVITNEKKSTDVVIPDPEPIETVNVTGRKIWVGGSAQTIRVQLYQNGVKYGDAVTFEIGKTSHTWTGLPKYNDNDLLYRYTIQEVNVPAGFIQEFSVDGLTITNRWILTDFIWGGGGIPTLIRDDHFAYVEGYPDGGFRPDAEITRAEVAAIFARLMVEKMRVGETYHSIYTDVHVGDWYYNYIGYLTRYNILNGYPDGSFKPDNPITRAEFSKVASMFDKIAGGGSNFSDVPASHWAKRFIDSAYNKGWIKGYPDGSFRPERNLTRAETVTVINRMLARYADESFVLANQSTVKYYNDGTRNHWAYFDIMEASNSHDYERIANNRERWIRLRPIE